MGSVIDQVVTDKYAIYNGDCVEVVGGLKDESVDFCIYSPPFASLYTYSNSDRDMGNVKDDEEFFQHFQFLVRELYRVMAPGRNMAVHCMNLPTSKTRDGFIGIKDFRGDLIRAFESVGFIQHSEVCIWKDPVLAMQRTKALGLLHKQLRKDSSMSRTGNAEYLCVFRKPGVNPEPISHTHEEYPVELWQRDASPVWMDVRQTNVLNGKAARCEQDERHICPLQLDVIERAIRLWTNKGDTIGTPFAGIGSELYQALLMGRRAVGWELKESYWREAQKFCEMAEAEAGCDLFTIK